MKKIRRALGSFKNVFKGESQRPSDGNTSKSRTLSTTSFSSTTEEEFARSSDRTYVRFDDQLTSQSFTDLSYANPLKETDPSFTKLHKAAFIGDLPKIKKALLKIGVNSEDDECRSPLHLCAFGGHPESVDFLLNYGANIEAEDKDGRTPFLRAVERGHIQATQILLQHKANAFVKDDFDTTALHLAARIPSTDMMELLLEIGLDPELPDARGQTPLHIAASNLNMDIVNYLLSKEADPNAADKEGVTALMIASKQGSKSLVEILLEAGADPEDVDSSGWNACSYAMFCGHEELNRWLETKMSDKLSTKEILSKVEDDTKSGQFSEDDEMNNSWNDDSSEEVNVFKDKAKMNLSRFMSTSNVSVNSNNNSHKSLSLNGSTIGPPKPPRSPINTPDSKHNSPKQDRSDHLLTTSFRPVADEDQEDAKLREISHGERKLSEADSENDTLKMFEAHNSGQSFSDVSFNDEEEGNMLFLDHSPNDTDIKESVDEKEKSGSDVIKDIGTISKSNNTPEVLVLESEDVNTNASSDESEENDDKNKTPRNLIYLKTTETPNEKIPNPADDKLTDFISPENKTLMHGDEVKSPTKALMTSDGDSKFEDTNRSPRSVLNEGTLGRRDTLHQLEEFWQANESVSLKDDFSEGSSSVDEEKSSSQKMECIDTSSLKKTFFGDSKENIFSKDVSEKMENSKSMDISNVLHEKNTEESVIKEDKMNDLPNEGQNHQLDISSDMKEPNEGVSYSNISKDDLVTSPINIPENLFTESEVNFPLNILPDNSKVVDEMSVTNEKNPKTSSKNILDEKQTLFPIEDDLHIYDHARSQSAILSFPEFNEEDFYSLNSINSQEPDCNFDFEEYSLDKLKLPLDVERVQQMVQNLKLHLNRELSKKENYLQRANKAEENETLLMEELKKNNLSSFQQHDDLVNLLSEKNKLKYELFRSADETNFVTFSLKNTENQVQSLEEENTTLKIELIGKDHLIKILEDDIETKTKIVSTWEDKFSFIPPLPKTEETFSQTLNEPTLSVETQTTNHSIDTDKVETSDVSTCTDMVVILDDNKNGNEEKLKAMEENVMFKKDYVHLSTQTSLTFFERVSIESQTEPELISETVHDTLENGRDSKGASELEYTVDYTSNETQTDFSFISEVIRSEHDSGIVKSDEKCVEAGVQTIFLPSEVGSSQTVDYTSNETQTDFSFISEVIRSEHDSGIEKSDEKGIEVGVQTIFLPSEVGFSQTDEVFMNDSSSQTEVIFKEASTYTSFSHNEYQNIVNLEFKSTQTDINLPDHNDPLVGLNDEYLHDIKLIVRESNTSLREFLDSFCSKIDVNIKTMTESVLKYPNVDKEQITSELHSFRDDLVKLLSTMESRISAEEINQQSQLLAKVQNQLNIIEQVSSKLDNLNSTVLDISPYSTETCEKVKENLETTKRINNLIENLQNDVLNGVDSDKTKLHVDLEAFNNTHSHKMEAISCNIDRLLSEFEVYIKQDEMKGKTLCDINGYVEDIRKRLNDYHIRASALEDDKQMQENRFAELIASVEELLSNNDNQLQRNLKTSLRNLDGTVGENFEIVQDLMTNFREDITRKINELISARAKEGNSRENEFEAMSTELAKVNNILSNLRGLIESQNTKPTTESLFDPCVIEAIRGGNEQALISIQAQGKTLLKTMEGIDKVLREMVEFSLSSKVDIARDREQNTQQFITTEKEHFMKEIENLERQNTTLENFLAREKSYGDEEKGKRKALENEIQSTKLEIESLKKANISLALVNENLNKKYESLIAKKIEQENIKNNTTNTQVPQTRGFPIQQRNEVQRNISFPVGVGSVHENEFKITNEVNLPQNEEVTVKLEHATNQQRRETMLRQIANLENLVRSKDARIRSLENDLSGESNFATEIEQELSNEARLLKERTKVLENDVRAKDKIVRNLKDRVTELETEREDQEMDLNIRATQVCELKSENILLQKKVRSMIQSFEEKKSSEQREEHLIQRIRELESEVSQKQSLILNLRERNRTLAQEKLDFVKENSVLKETKISTDLLLKEREETHHSLMELQKAYEKLSGSVGDDFVPKAKLQKLYEEMEGQFDALFRKRLYEYQKPILEDFKFLERANEALREREKAFKNEIKSLQSQVQLLSGKTNLALHNVHLWKSKYQQLCDERFKTNKANEKGVVFNDRLSSTVSENTSGKRESEYSYTNTLENINTLLRRPYETSEFLKSGNNTTPSKPPLQYDLQSPALRSNIRSPETERYVVLSSIENSLKKYLPAERDGTDEVSASKEVTNTSVPRNSASEVQPLQQSFDSYVNFLSRI